MLCPLCNLAKHPSKGCSARKRSGKRPPKPILSFDCETTDAGIVLFLASGTDRRGNYVYNHEGLSLETIFTWMVSIGYNHRCFGYYFNYDVTQLVRLLPSAHILQLAAAGKVTWRQWRIRHIPGKRFYVSDGTRSATIWDVSSWAQTSFAKIAREWLLGTEAERAVIEAMKARRGSFESASELELVEYTTLECSLLSEWVIRLIALHERVGIRLRAYSGPGSTASALYRKQGFRPPEVPALVQEIAERAFFGGRTEISCVGPVPGPVYGYDINSAYPWAISELPQIGGAAWKETHNFHPGAWGFYYVHWDLPDRTVWGPFPVRGAMLPSGRRSVSLLYPIRGCGWYHSHEVAAALACWPEGVQVTRGWLIDPQGSPFAWVRDTAEQRLTLKRTGDPAQFPLKVGLNAMYGKLAQHTGRHPLQSMTYAAAITSRTRASLLYLAARHGHDILLLATDGILSLTPLDLPVGEGLGEWDRTLYPSAWILQAGVYWAGDKQRSRGVDARALTLERTQSIWDIRKTKGEVTIVLRRVLSYRLCAAQNKPDQTGEWVDAPRTIRFSPFPRRKPFHWNRGRLLTLPADVDSYAAAAAMDAALLAMDPTASMDPDESMPHWSLET